MTHYFSFAPEHFNNNGDQGNIEVLRYFLTSQGVEFEQTDAIESADFVLIGDASRAAIAHYELELFELVPILQARFDQGLPTLIVGSSYELLAGRIRGLEAQQLGPRFSGFASTELTPGIRVGGYKNSEMVGADIEMSGLFIATKYFGPVLAKNPELLDMILVGLGAQMAQWPKQMLDLVQLVRQTSSY